MSVGLVMPMAGRGSRFVLEGISEPKPLIDLGGKPFFWWAVESLRRATKVEEMVFVVLEDHEKDFDISSRIHRYYPDAKVICIPDVTSGSAETASIGLEAIKGSGPVAINDCDHAFIAEGLDQTLTALEGGSAAALLSFRSSNPGFSYVQLDGKDRVCGTIEKQVASPFAIAGCYLIQSASVFQRHYRSYREFWAYSELFISGIYNEMLRESQTIELNVLKEHFPFGTPEEYRAIREPMLERLKEWA